MPVPSHELDMVELWCSGLVPDHARDQLEVVHTVRATTVTIVERRYLSHDDRWSEMPAARLRRANASGLWTVFCFDSNGRAVRFDPAPRDLTLAGALAVVEQDETGIFWG